VVPTDAEYISDLAELVTIILLVIVADTNYYFDRKSVVYATVFPHTFWAGNKLKLLPTPSPHTYIHTNKHINTHI
jgi:hypothetical protein